MTLHLHHHGEPTDEQRLAGALDLAMSLAKGMDPKAALRQIDAWARPTLSELRTDVASQTAGKRWGQ